MLRLKNFPSKEEKEKYAGKLIELWLEIWPYCHLHCGYCFNRAGCKVDKEGLLLLDQYKSIISQFKNLGGRVLGIPGNGEPLHPKNYELTMAIIKQAYNLGVRTQLFTSGDLIDETRAKTLKELDVSLVIKYNSDIPLVQDGLVSSTGYTKRRSVAITTLKRLGFMRPDIDEYGNNVTSVGFVTPVLKENYHELPGIFRRCLNQNIYPDIDTILPLGRGESFSAEEEDRVKKMFLKLQSIAKEFGYDWNTSITYAGLGCDRCKNHLYVDCRGNISPCLGANKKGVILADATDKDAIAKAWESPLMLKIRARDYSGKCPKCKSFKDDSCNSCLGRCVTSISLKDIETTGCQFFEE